MTTQPIMENLSFPCVSDFQQVFHIKIKVKVEKEKKKVNKKINKKKIQKII